MKSGASEIEGDSVGRLEYAGILDGFRVNS